ncbi:MAG: hypothetical protein ACREYF_12495 [Gammaproteobacteria bacterium]
MLGFERIRLGDRRSSRCGSRAPPKCQIASAADFFTSLERRQDVVTVALLVRLRVQCGKEADVESFLSDGAAGYYYGTFRVLEAVAPLIAVL